MSRIRFTSSKYALLTLLMVLFSATSLMALPYGQGDVFVSLRNGTVREYTPAGVLVQTLVTGRSGELTGSAFDSSANFYVTAGFTGGDVLKFDTTGVLQGPFGSGYVNNPESILFDSAGNAWVGAADSIAGNGTLKKFSSTGTPLATFSLAAEDRGVDWIDLAADGKTMFYTSEGSQIKRFDVSTNTQLSDFGAGGGTQYALRILDDGGVLVANTVNVLRYNSAGVVVQTYLFGSNLLFALNLDPDGVSLWTAEYFTGVVYRVNIATGAVISQFNVGQGVSGLSILGERTQQTPVPEPASILLLGIAIGGVAAIRRKLTKV